MRQTRHATKKRIMALLLSVLMLIALAAPEAVMAASRKKKAVSPSVQYAVTQYGYGWTGYLSNGQTAGRTNKARRLEMVRVRLRNLANDRAFAEYYLVWTLLSTLCALTVVAIEKWLAG